MKKKTAQLTTKPLYHCERVRIMKRSDLQRQSKVVAVVLVVILAVAEKKCARLQTKACKYILCNRKRERERERKKSEYRNNVEE